MKDDFDAVTETAHVARLQGIWAGLGTHRTSPEFLPSQEDRAALRALERLETRLIAQGRWASGPATLFGALGLLNHEIANCRALAWLLDPLAPHGLGAALLKALLVHLNTVADAPVLPVGADLQRAVIVTEDPRDRSRADLVVYGPGWSIVIEAKLGASEGHEQGARLAADWPDSVYVFLTRRGAPMRTAGDDAWLPITWTAMLELVRAALENAAEPTTAAMVTARAAVRDYLIATRHMEHTHS